MVHRNVRKVVPVIFNLKRKNESNRHAAQQYEEFHDYRLSRGRQGLSRPGARIKQTCILYACYREFAEASMNIWKHEYGGLTPSAAHYTVNRLLKGVSRRRFGDESGQAFLLYGRCGGVSICSAGFGVD